MKCHHSGNFSYQEYKKKVHTFTSEKTKQTNKQTKIKFQTFKHTKITVSFFLFHCIGRSTNFDKRDIISEKETFNRSHSLQGADNQLMNKFFLLLRVRWGSTFLSEFLR